MVKGRSGDVNINTNAISTPARVLIYSTAAVLLTIGMKAISSILMPIFFSIFSYLIFAPLVRWLMRKRVPGKISVVLVILVFIFVFVGTTLLFANSLLQLSGRIPNYENQLTSILNSISIYLPEAGVSVESVLRDIAAFAFNVSGDIISGAIGGPAGTNYGENISAMAISKNFSIHVLMLAAILTMVISCFTPLINIIYSIPTAVIGGLSIYLFGVIGAQGITIMLDRKVDMFSSKNLAVIAVILIVGLGGSFGFEGGMIPMFGIEIPAIASAAVVGILLNLMLSIGEKQ